MPPKDGSCPVGAANSEPCSGNGACTYGPGTCLCYDGYSGLDCGHIDPVPLFVKSKASAVVYCGVRNPPKSSKGDERFVLL